MRSDFLGRKDIARCSDAQVGRFMLSWGVGWGVSSPLEHGPATTIKLARILKLEDWDGLRSIPNLEGFDPGSE
jgi:hypothetical protein